MGESELFALKAHRCASHGHANQGIYMLLYRCASHGHANQGI